jgi:hypothetical protein
MAKKYTTDTLSATEGIYGKQLYTDTGETVANIVSYTETGGVVINNIYDVRLQDYGVFYLDMFDFMNQQLPTFYVGDNILVYNQNGSEVSVLVDSVGYSVPDYAQLEVSIVSGTPSGSYLPQYGTSSVVTNIITDTDITGILNPNDYVFLGLDAYLLDTASGTNISISKTVPDIANILSIQSNSDFPILNYRSVLANGTVSTAPLPVYFNTITNTSNLLGLKLATNSSLDNFFVGDQAGSGTSVTNAVFIGTQAGKDSDITQDSLFIGNQAGFEAWNTNRATFIGGFSGYQATSGFGSLYVGFNSGKSSSNSSKSVFIGEFAGGLTTNVRDSIIIGFNAGYQSSGNNVIALGRTSARSNSGNNVIALGDQAAIGNALSGQTIFSNAALPSYANRSAATTAITVANGASRGNTYLYYNSSNFQIEGVRL